jgi:hypothetical protein
MKHARLQNRFHLCQFLQGRSGGIHEIRGRVYQSGPAHASGASPATHKLLFLALTYLKTKEIASLT